MATDCLRDPGPGTTDQGSNVPYNEDVTFPVPVVVVEPDAERCGTSMYFPDLRAGPVDFDATDASDFQTQHRYDSEGCGSLFVYPQRKIVTDSTSCAGRQYASAAFMLISCSITIVLPTHTTRKLRIICTA